MQQYFDRVQIALPVIKILIYYKDMSNTIALWWQENCRADIDSLAAR